MKKTMILMAATLLAAGTASAQEAFKHLSAGLDVGTTGVGLELAVPVVTDHLVFTAGYNYGSFAMNINPKNGLDLSSLSSELNSYVSKANNFLATTPESSRLTSFSNSAKITGDGNIKLGTFKAVLEYYPIKSFGFHINAGLFFGSADALTINATMTDYWNTYEENVEKVNQFKQDYPTYSGLVGSIPEAKASIHGKTYQIKDPGTVNLSLGIAKVRPYLGLGFGKSIPDTHFGFQFDLGAIYTGKIAVNSTNEVSGTCDITIENDTVDKVFDLAEKLCVYPQMSFRLIYKIF